MQRPPGAGCLLAGGLGAGPMLSGRMGAGHAVLVVPEGNGYLLPADKGRKESGESPHMRDVVDRVVP